MNVFLEKDIFYLIFLVFQDRYFEQLGILEPNAAECQVALENLKMDCQNKYEHDIVVIYFAKRPIAVLRFCGQCLRME
jgi:hypothetical protein